MATDLLRIMADWGWTAAGTLAAGLGSLAVARVKKIEEQVESKAPITDLKDLNVKHDQLREDMHKLFREQNDTFTARHIELLTAISQKN